MRKINEELFFADYDLALSAKEAKLANKDEAIRLETEKAERVISENGYSDSVKELLLGEIAKEKEAEFDVSKDDEILAGFEKYIEIVEDEVVAPEHPADCECEECLAKKAEAQLDAPVNE